MGTYIAKPVILLSDDEYNNEKFVNDLDYILGDINNDLIDRSKLSRADFRVHLDLLYTEVGDGVLTVFEKADALNKFVVTFKYATKSSFDTVLLTDSNNKFNRIKNIIKEHTGEKNDNLLYTNERKNKILKNSSHYLLDIALLYNRNIENIVKLKHNAIYLKDSNNLRVLLTDINKDKDSFYIEENSNLLRFIYSIFVEANVITKEIERDLNIPYTNNYISYFEPITSLMY